MLQFQPDPEASTRVKPAGSVSVTVTVPVVGPVPLFETSRPNGKPCSPWMTGSGCDLTIVSCGRPWIVVASGAVVLVRLISPPPLTVAMFVGVNGTGPTLTVIVSAGYAWCRSEGVAATASDRLRLDRACPPGAACRHRRHALWHGILDDHFARRGPGADIAHGHVVRRGLLADEEIALVRFGDFKSGTRGTGMTLVGSLAVLFPR